MNLNKKLCEIQSSLVANKEAYNSFANFKYRSCESILESLKPYLKKYQVIINLSDDIVLIGDRYYIKSTASITDGEDTIESVAFAREELTKKGMDGSQVTGASSSYARKYALCGLFAIDDNKDADSMDNRVKEIPICSDDKFQENIIKWRKLITEFKGDKRQKAESIIAGLSNRTKFTEKQKKTIISYAQEDIK